METLLRIFEKELIGLALDKQEYRYDMESGHH